MSHDPQAHRWLLEWSDDSGDPDHDSRATADTVEEARAAMKKKRCQDPFPSTHSVKGS